VRGFIGSLGDKILPIVRQNATATGTDPVGYLSEAPGMSAFTLEDGAVYQTYATTARGLEFVMTDYPILDRVPTRAIRPRPGFGVMTSTPEASKEIMASSAPARDTDFNTETIEEFRANGGHVGGLLAGTTMVLVHYIGARSGI
jgi:hypothetical protein